MKWILTRILESIEGGLEEKKKSRSFEPKKKIILLCSCIKALFQMIVYAPQFLCRDGNNP